MAKDDPKKKPPQPQSNGFSGWEGAGRFIENTAKFAGNVAGFWLGADQPNFQYATAPVQQQQPQPQQQPQQQPQPAATSPARFGSTPSLGPFGGPGGPVTPQGQVNEFGEVAPTASPQEQNRLLQSRGENSYVPDFARNNQITDRGIYGENSRIFQRQPQNVGEAREYGNLGIFSDSYRGTLPGSLNEGIRKSGQTLGFGPQDDAAVVKARRDATSKFLQENQVRLNQRAEQRNLRRLERMATSRVDLNQGLSEYFTNVSNRRYARDVLKDRRASDAASKLQGQKDVAARDREEFKQANENARTSATNRTKLSVEGAKRYAEFIDSTVDALGGADKGVSRAQVESTMNLAVNAYDAYMKKADPENYQPLGGDPATWEGFDRSILGVVSEALMKGAKPEQVEDLIRQTIASYGTGRERS